jgi:outer membrane protein assembly factor BamB
MAEGEVTITCPRCRQAGVVARDLLGDEVNCPACGEPFLAERREPAATRRIEQLVFVGLNGYAVALDRDTGEIVWSNDQLNSGYVTLLLDGDRLVVSTNGYIFCLDPLTGRVLWNNRMSGYGPESPTSLISVRGQGSQTIVQQAAEESARRHSSGTGGV